VQGIGYWSGKSVVNLSQVNTNGKLVYGVNSVVSEVDNPQALAAYAVRGEATTDGGTAYGGYFKATKTGTGVAAYGLYVEAGDVLLGGTNTKSCTVLKTDVNGKVSCGTIIGGVTYPLSLPNAGFDIQFTNNDWNGFNLDANLKRIILGVNHADGVRNVFDIEEVDNSWNHKMELRTDGSAAFNGYVSVAPGTNGGYRIYDNTGHTDGVYTTGSWFEINYDTVNGIGTFQRTIAPTANDFVDLGLTDLRWRTAYTNGLDVKGDVIIDLT